nr:PREDICTED: uncharacterized protein LOC105671631 [Linepithema humile]
MYVTLIPFFLAANIVVNDRSEWTFGPEYLYNLQVTHFSSEKLPWHRNVSSTVKCRPKMEDSLFCDLQYFKTFDEQKEFVLYTSVIFEMKFNESGVEKIFTNSSDPFKRELMQKIAQRFSTGIHVQRNFDGDSIYWEKKWIIINGNECFVRYSVEYLEPEINMSKQNKDFQLVILPMFDVKPDSSLEVIGYLYCNDHCSIPIDFQIKFNGATQINNRYDGPIYVINMHYAQHFGLFREKIQLTLESIKPAQNKPMDIFNGSWFSPIIYK